MNHSILIDYQNEIYKTKKFFLNLLFQFRGRVETRPVLEITLQSRVSIDHT